MVLMSGDDVAAQPKYEVGQTVYFTNGKFGEYECQVESVSLGYQGATSFLPYTQPIYRICWPPTGGASVHESALSPTPKNPDHEQAR